MALTSKRGTMKKHFEGCNCDDCFAKWKKKIIKDLIVSLKVRKLINRFDDDDLNELYKIGTQYTGIVEKHGDMDFYSRLYTELKKSSEFKYLLVKKMMKHPALLFDYFF